MTNRARRMNQRGRWVLLWTAALFLLIQFSASALLEHYGLPIRFPQAAQILALLQARGNAHDIIVFGSSRFRTGVAMGVVQNRLRELTGDGAVSVFNAAVPGGDLTTTDFLLEQMLKLGVQPRVAVIEISPENLARRNQWMSEHVRRQATWENAIRYLDQCRHEDQLGALLRNLCVPLSAHRYPLCQEAGRLWREGWGEWSKPYALSGKLARTVEPKPAATEDRDNYRNSYPRGIPSLRIPSFHSHSVDEPARAMQIPDGALAATSKGGTETIRRWLRDYDIGGVSATALERLLTRCHRHGIVPVLVVPPLASVHRDLYTKEINARFFAHLDAVRGAHSFTFADFRASLPDDCLVDNHHLSVAGSEVFSEILARELLAPMWMQFRQ